MLYEYRHYLTSGNKIKVDISIDDGDDDDDFESSDDLELFSAVAHLGDLE